jgi:hypothetical protein
MHRIVQLDVPLRALRTQGDQLHGLLVPSRATVAHPEKGRRDVACKRTTARMGSKALFGSESGHVESLNVLVETSLGSAKERTVNSLYPIVNPRDNRVSKFLSYATHTA